MSVSSHNPNVASDHSTGVADSGRWSTKRIAVYALFVALSMVLSFVEVPIFPAAPFLKYDPSGIVMLIVGFAYGPAAAAIVSVLGFVPHLFTNPWGALMAILVALSLSVPAAFIYRRKRTRAGAVIGMLVGAALAVVVAILGNLVITPIYTGWPVSEVAALIVPALLPFNILKMAIHGVVTFLIYRPISNLLDKRI
ncbi:ECF transporter S component [Bifidobacterium sp. UBA744]|uniref:ECF transporter S component n=1 Tax=Bifidobacterium sp. UBA744 TaxID=1946112 RepID=UPI0025C1481B|nr:ECF transporter S component [Bifidobacterium sp. UBA744]